MSEQTLKGDVSRRSVLKGAAAGAGVVAAGGFLSAGAGAGAASAAGKTVSVGSNQSDPAARKSDTAWVAAATKAGFDVKLNTVDHNTFQNQINSYLQGTPDDVFTWFAGYRMQFFASKGLSTDISDVWSKIGKDFTKGYKTASTGLDGKQYFVPTTWYPWAVMYRKSVFKAAGVDPASIVTWADFISACKVFKSKGLTPVALGDKGGWEAMGTFDLFNMRTNGYKFHVDLMGGRASWGDARVQKTFTNWQTMFPYQNANTLDLEWSDAAQLVLQKKAAMQIMGAFHASIYTDAADLADLALFPFPEINKANRRNAVDAPIDGYMLSKGASKNLANAKSLATFIASTDYANAVLSVAPTALFANSNMPASDNAFVRQQVELVKGSKYIAQFLDRDTRPDFAGPIVGPAIQSFLKTPGDKAKIAANLAKQWDALPPA